MEDFSKYIGMTHYCAWLDLADITNIKDAKFHILKDTITDIKVKTNKKGETYTLIQVNGKPYGYRNRMNEECTKRFLDHFTKTRLPYELKTEDTHEICCNHIWTKTTKEANIRTRLEKAAVKLFRKRIEELEQEKEDFLVNYQNKKAKFFAIIQK